MKEINDRFTFDKKFRQLLNESFSHKSAKDIIMNNYSLNLIIIQERIENGFYRSIRPEEKISADLIELRNNIYNEVFLYKN